MSSALSRDATWNQPRRLKPWHPRHIKPRHRIVASMHASGLTNQEIAKLTGYTEARVSVIVNDPRVQQYVKEMMGEIDDFVPDVRARLEEHSNEALDNVLEIMRGTEDDRVSLSASFGILDRAGYSKVDKKIIATADLSPKAAELLGDALRESREIEVEYEEEPEPDEIPLGDTVGD